MAVSTIPVCPPSFPLRIVPLDPGVSGGYDSLSWGGHIIQAGQAWHLTKQNPLEEIAIDVDG